MAGFELQTPDRFPGTVAATKGNCIALLRHTPGGFSVVALPGWRIQTPATGGEVIGVLVERQGRKVFQHKSEEIEATTERVGELDAFREELGRLLGAVA